MKILNLAGYTVLWCPFPSPLTTVRAMINAGSAQESVWGTAHFLEHMFFKGSKNTSQGQLEKKVEQVS
jgi:predicted Zn-dependent peptidase